MTLGRRLVWQLTLLLGCLLVTAGIGLWEASGVRQDYSLALDRYEKLRELYQIGFHLQASRLALSIDFPDYQRARLEARRAQQVFGRAADEMAADRSASAAQLASITRALSSGAAALDGPRPRATALDAPYAALQQLVDQFRSDIAAAQRAAERRRQKTVLWIGGVAMAAVAISVLTAVRQYRAVMRPLAQTAAGVRRVAAGEFQPAIDLGDADAEFQSLAADFNQMAARLEATLADMQQRVESATRTLVQSERLAGVGLLAAGVAHEVSNPLSIITGRLELLAAAARDDASRRQMNELIEEGFRCKAIIERLLQLSRGPTGQRVRLRLDLLARDAAAAIGELPAAAGRAIAFRGEPAAVVADAGELRQVLINLLINAVQFTPPGAAIDVQVAAAGTSAELSVRDGGAGMTGDELKRIFEPFFTSRRGRADGAARGTGLGLAISQAIIEAHGGRINAFSDGPGCGSRFVVSLPRAEDEAE